MEWYLANQAVNSPLEVWGCNHSCMSQNRAVGNEGESHPRPAAQVRQGPDGECDLQLIPTSWGHSQLSEWSLCCSCTLALDTKQDSMSIPKWLQWGPVCSAARSLGLGGWERQCVLEEGCSAGHRAGRALTGLLPLSNLLWDSQPGFLSAQLNLDTPLQSENPGLP